MAYNRPIVLEDVSLADFVQYVLNQHGGPSTLVVCGTKDAFLEALKEPTTRNQNGGEDRTAQRQAVEQAPGTEDSGRRSIQHRSWTAPTLRMLSTSRTVKVAFCPDITHLRAYLATYSMCLAEQSAAGSSSINNVNGTLAILNPIQLHRPTSAFSAQGVNRTFSAAVEAAYCTQSQLVIAECPATSSRSAAEEVDVPDVDFMAEGQKPPAEERPVPQSLWDEEVSILNVTTKSFGAGERGWVGRTVKFRSIAERWCRFETLPAGAENEAGVVTDGHQTLPELEATEW